MLPKSQLQFIKSLQQKKFRKLHNCFVVEGFKSIVEFLHSAYSIQDVFYTENAESKIGIFQKNTKLFYITEKELAQISSLKTPQGMLAVIEIPSNPDFTAASLKNQFSLVLDYVQDPGNMGTIIRTADWFGIKNIICSEDTVDIYNPKVVQATMGSLAHVNIGYMELSSLFDQVRLPVYAAMLDGQSIYETRFEGEGLVLLGNEGNGVNPKLLRKETKGITIPRFGKAESLNVAISAAIFSSEISRQQVIAHKK